MIRCGKCGYENNDGQTVCSNCGCNLSSNGNKQFNFGNHIGVSNKGTVTETSQEAIESNQRGKSADSKTIKSLKPIFKTLYTIQLIVSIFIPAATFLATYMYFDGITSFIFLPFVFAGISLACLIAIIFSKNKKAILNSIFVFIFLSASSVIFIGIAAVING